MLAVQDVFRPANLENVFTGTFRVKKRDLPAKSGTVGRAHIEIFLKCTAYRNQLRSKIHCSTAIRPRYRLVFMREIERNCRNYHDVAGRGTSGKKTELSRQKRDGWQVCVFTQCTLLIATKDCTMETTASVFRDRCVCVCLACH